MTRHLAYDAVPQRTRCQYSQGYFCEWTWVERYVAGDPSRDPKLLFSDDGEPPDLCPDFQRGHVWTASQQRAWLEFRMSGGWGGDVVLFNRYPDTRVVLVDGLQRLTAVRAFMTDEIRVFQHLSDDGRGFVRSELEPRCYSAMTRGGHLTLVVNTLSSRAEVLQWYLELNSCGTPHSDEELDRVRRLLESEFRK